MTSAPILIDSRAGSRDLATLPPLRHIAQLATLRSGDRELGDVMIYGRGDRGLPLRIVVEVKSTSDFISSMPRNGGRIAAQVVDVLGYNGGEALADEYYLAVYGTRVEGDDGALLVPVDECPYPNPRDVRVTKELPGLRLTPYRTARDRAPIRYDEVESTILTLTRAGAQRAPHLPTKLDVAKWIYILYKHVSRPPSAHCSLRTLPDRGMREFLPPALDNVTRRLIGVASALLVDGGIGGKTAAALAEKFGSVHEMINADEREFRIPKLIGAPTGKRIVEAIHEERRR